MVILQYRKSGIFHLFSKYIKEKFTIGNIHILLVDTWHESTCISELARAIALGGRLAGRSPLGSGSPSFLWKYCKIDITVLSVLMITKKQLSECHTCSDTWLCYDYYTIHKCIKKIVQSINVHIS